MILRVCQPKATLAEITARVKKILGKRADEKEIKEYVKILQEARDEVNTPG